MNLKLAAGSLALAGLGAVGGAAIYAAFDPQTTTTVVASSSAPKPDLPLAPPAKGLSAQQIYRLAAPGVVDLKVVRIEEDQFGGGGLQEVDGIGTGFVYNRRGDIVTNDHVAAGAKSITVKFSGNQTFKGRVVGRDTDSDLAVIRVAAPRSLLRPLRLGDSSRVQVGDAVVAIGSPFGHAGSLSAGVVSGLHVPLNSPSDIPTDSIQTDAPINPGSSGGPLLNTLGQVIGIATSTQSRSGNSNGVGFVIPSNIVRSVVVELIAGRKVKHAYFGASLEDSTSPLGARLVSVSRSGPSADAGMKKGDVVTAVDGVGVAEAADMISLTRAHLAGDTVSVAFMRGGRSQTVNVELGTRPA
jgi:putative serine protease PepD